MHRHGYKGRKLGRERDERRALLRGLCKSLFEHSRIETTLPKAKELRRHAEKLITYAKKGDLASRRLLISRLGGDVFVANLLVDQIAPQIKRSSGFLRIERTRLREGDRAQMAIIEFVDEINYETNEPEEDKSEKPKVEKSTKDTEETK
ncbi:MAG: 50S ribosomal protein L17 [Candidatus Nanosyncoccaceae bacterium]|jgi:large subunit ribosomal protein L17